MATLPKKISKYQVLGVAGKGAMGQVYLGHDPFVDRNVAIKVCDDGETSATSQVRRMFLNEARAAGALDHPNVLRIYDADDADGQLFIVMEYIEGGKNLKRYCNPDALLPVETIIDYVEQCALGLEYAHSKGVLHRDIKPANILLTKEGQAKIADFGVAQRLMMDATVDGGVFGSPLYMSPEQLNGGDLTGLTDLYSLGVTMFELFAGRPPFVADTVSQLIAKIATEQAPNILEFRPDLPPAVVDVVMKAIQKPRDMRFDSGSAMAAALGKVRVAQWSDTNDLNESELAELARGLDFFKDFSDRELEQVLEVGSWRRFSAFELLMSEGQRESFIMVIGTGETIVRVQDQSIATLTAGDCVGELEFLSGEPRSATVVADKEVWALQIDSPPSEWASLSVQLRFTRAIERTLVSRLKETSLRLAQALD